MNTINTCWLEISIGRTVRAKPTVSIGSCQNIRVFYDIPIDSLVWSEVFMFATSQLLDHNIRRIHSSHFNWIVERKTRVTQMVCCLPESSWKQKKIDQVFEHICYTINSVLFIRMFKFVWFDHFYPDSYSISIFLAGLIELETVENIWFEIAFPFGFATYVMEDHHTWQQWNNDSNAN